MKVVILAGGGGTRLWPFSRLDYPKQFLVFKDQESLLQKSVKRFVDLSFVEKIIVVTQAHYAHLVEKQLAKIDPDGKIRILVEPYRKNTAPAISLAVRYIEEKLGASSDSPILILPSDHLISPEDVFLSYLMKVKEKRVQDKIVTFGIFPNRPETGYGYIQAGKKKNALFHEVKRFVEKPDLEKAKQYLFEGNYYWNAGIFFFTPNVYWQELQRHAPEIYTIARESYLELFHRFDQMPDISIDYALMEKTHNLLLCPLPVSWSDVGCWDSVYDVLEKDHNANVKVGNVVDIDTKNSLIMGGKKLISTIGLEDVLIVETPDALFMAKKGESQKVKKLIEELQKRGQKEENRLTLEQEEEKNSTMVVHKIASLSKISFEAKIEKTRYFIATAGKALAQKMGKEKRVLLPHEMIFLLEKESLTIENLETTPFELLEIELQKTLPEGIKSGK
jgi:mannose-1-phosphate guanylyltransferase / mannose-6-phosphate isomerase